MGDRIKNISAIIIIIIILLPILAVYIISPVYNELSKKDISYDYVIQDTLIKTIVKKYNEFGTRTVVSGRSSRRYSTINTDYTVHNTYMFIYNDGSIEEVNKEQYDFKKEGDTIKELFYKYGIDEKKFNNFKGVKHKEVWIKSFISDFYEVKYLNNKVIDTTRQ